MEIDVEIEWAAVFNNLFRLGITFLLSIPVAWQRERKTHSVGLRTYPLVAVGTCAFILIGKSFLEIETESMSRVFHGVITGMGFIGGGAIIKNDDYVSGTANAASLWCTGAIGAAVAFNRLEIAIVLSLTILIIFKFKTVMSKNGNIKSVNE
ncbi:MAG: magnesium transporter MgtC [Halobacteriovoraceae bacterium]|nr:magnesium transporter MgtC [Halobacteriovoraceae bacterium]|tara:strand:- start:17657 stop:18112 length:456 start_codon:yes stop_codon:yes gene_type:complete